MNQYLITILVLNEARLRLRRLSTLVALMAVIAISWAMIADPHTGMTLMTVKSARVLYTSSALAFGSSTMASILFGLGGFYLVRGRIAEDLRSGAVSVIAATQAGNGLFLFSRWLGGVLYLFTLIVALMGTMLVCHVLRGEGPIELMVYLQTYAIVLVPMVFFSVSCAILFDSIPALMGKLGDVIFFFVWMGQISLMAALDESNAAIGIPLMFLDFSGLATCMINLKQHLNTMHMSIGMSSFNAALPTVTLPAFLWSAQIMWMRCASAIIAVFPLLPAILLFHRYSPDRVKLSGARKRRNPLEVINGWLRPLSKTVQPLFRLASVVPGFWGQVLADIALTLVTSPSAIVVLAVTLIASLFFDVAGLAGVLVGCVAYWGVLVTEISTRDFQTNTEELTGTVPGGVTQRYLRQFSATGLLGLLFMGVIALRLSVSSPLLAAALVSGVLSLAALATLFGRCSRTARTFLALFLFWLYVSMDATTVPMLDVVGFNHAATLDSVLTQLMIASVALLAGYVYNRPRAY